MNLHPQHQEARRRRLVNRSAAQHRRIFFETVRGNTVTNASPPVRRGAVRVQPDFQDIEDPAMTRILQAAIVLAILATLFAVRSPLLLALTSWLSFGTTS